MKAFLRSSAALCLTAWCFLVPARADFATTFTGPPYVVDETVLGVDGWESRFPPNEQTPHTARVVAVRWHDYRPALMLKRASLKHTFPATTSERVRITFELAVTFPDAGPAGKQVRLGFDTAPFGELYFDQGAEGGLGYLGDGSGKAGVVLLPKAEMKVNSFYTFTVLTDFRKRTFDLTVTGKKKDHSPFVFKVEQAAFPPTAGSKTKISSLYLLTGPGVTAYLGPLTIQSQ